MTTQQTTIPKTKMTGMSGLSDSMGDVFLWSVRGIRIGGPGPKLDDSITVVFSPFELALTTIIGSDIVRDFCCTRWLCFDPFDWIGHEPKVAGFNLVSWPLIAPFLPVNKDNYVNIR